MLRFGHSGDFGDLIYSLAAIKALGGGELVLFPSDWTREPMTPRRAEWLRPLLEQQSYLTKVSFREYGANLDYDLNDFRFEFNDYLTRRIGKSRRLVDCVLELCGCSPDTASEPWLEMPLLDLYSGTVETGHAIINRTGRYQNHSFPWPKVITCYGPMLRFVGTELEHARFIAQFGSVPYVPVANALELALTIQHSRIFIGNQSLCYALAEGMHVSPVVLEVYPDSPDCLFERVGVYHGWDKDVPLPAARQSDA